MASLCSPHDKKGDQPVGELLLPVGVGRPGAAALGVTVPPLPGRPILTEPGVPVGTSQVRDAVRAAAVAGFSRRDDFYHLLRATLITRHQVILPPHDDRRATRVIDSAAHVEAIVTLAEGDTIDVTTGL